MDHYTADPQVIQPVRLPAKPRFRTAAHGWICPSLFAAPIAAEIHRLYRHKRGVSLRQGLNSDSFGVQAIVCKCCELKFAPLNFSLKAGL